MAMLSTADLEDMRGDLARELLGQTITLLAPQSDQDATGGEVTTWFPVATCSGRVIRDSAPSEVITAERIQGIERYEIRLAYTMRRTGELNDVPTDLSAAQRLQIGSEVFEIAGADSSRSERLYLSVTVVKAH